MLTAGCHDGQGKKNGQPDPESLMCQVLRALLPTAQRPQLCSLLSSHRSWAVTCHLSLTASGAGVSICSRRERWGDALGECKLWTSLSSSRGTRVERGRRVEDGACRCHHWRLQPGLRLPTAYPGFQDQHFQDFRHWLCVCMNPENSVYFAAREGVCRSGMDVPHEAIPEQGHKSAHNTPAA